MNRVQIVTGFVLTLCLMNLGNSAHAQFENLVLHLPNGANTLLLLNAEEMLSSPLAAKEGWRKKEENAFASGITLLSPQVNQLAMAARIDFETNRANWRAAVMNVSSEPSMPEVAAEHGGTVDQIEHRDAAILPNDTVVVEFGKNLAGVLTPGNRQQVGEWIRDVYSSSSRKPLSGYLQEAETFADRGAPIIMAIDLQNVVSQKVIRDRLNSSPTLQGKDVDLDKLSTVLASIRGVTLGITIGDQVFGKVKVDFGEDISIMKDFAKPLLLEALSNHGAMINEFRDWTASVSGKQFSIEGDLLQSGRQRILSLLDAPPALQAPPKQTPASGEQDQNSLVALTSQQYFNSIKQFLDDLHGKGQSHDFTTPGEIAVWYERYASKIDSLRILNVDRDLVEFGSYVANQLRQGQTAMQGVGERSALRVSEKPNATAYNYAYAAGGRAGFNRYGGYARGGYAYAYRYNPRLSLKLEGQQRSRIHMQERIRGATAAHTITQGLQEEMAHMREVLTDRYDVEF